MTQFEIAIPKFTTLLKQIESDGPSWLPGGGKYRDWVSRLKGELRVIPDNESWLGQVEEVARFSSVTMVHRFDAPSDPPKVSQEDHASRIQNLTAITKELLTELNARVQISDAEKSKPQPEPPRIFIAHGGRTSARDSLVAFIRALGCDPIIVEDQPGASLSTGSKVGNYLKSADYAVVLATKKNGAVQDGKLLPRANVVEETGRIQLSHPSRRMLIKEKGVVLPSNDSDWVYGTFSQANLTETFIQLARELVEVGLIRVGKGSKA